MSSSGIDGAAEVSDPPALPSDAIRGVSAALRRTRASCLERSLVLQRWYAAHGQRRDLIIGVTAPGEEFRAHAWLEGDHPCHDGEYTELLRRSAS